MRQLAGIALILTLTAAELSPAPRPRARRERPPRCVALRVEAADGEGRRGRGRTFSAEEVADLRFEVWLHERFASEPLTVKLFTPRDKLYQVLDVGADAGASPTSGLRGRLAARFHIQTLVARFPVAGTHVTTYAMYGEWRAEAYIGDADAPCVRPLEFVIEP